MSFTYSPIQQLSLKMVSEFIIISKSLADKFLLNAGYENQNENQNVGIHTYKAIH